MEPVSCKVIASDEAYPGPHGFMYLADDQNGIVLLPELDPIHD